MTEQYLWKTPDVAQYLGIPLSSVYKMTGPKSPIRMPHIRIAGKVRFRKADIDRWLDQFAVSTNGLFAKINARMDQEACHHGLHS
ncbi:MAG: helix-turn-helix domain-containing protein [Acidobacteria bacterium]|nr:helix-turn-helix domain-containing protein [Acidobacteriota bacterium]